MWTLFFELHTGPVAQAAIKGLTHDRYAHVSPKSQSLEQQRAALDAAGCACIFDEDNTEGRCDQPELARMLDHLRPGDVVTVTHLDRLARSRPDFLAIAVRIKQADAGLRSLAETWADTTTPDGSALLTFLAGIVDFERGLIAERTSASRVEVMRFRERMTAMLADRFPQTEICDFGHIGDGGGRYRILRKRPCRHNGAMVERTNGGADHMAEAGEAPDVWSWEARSPASKADRRRLIIEIASYPKFNAD